MHQHRATAAGHLARDGVGLPDLVPPVALAHRDNGELGQDDGPADGSGYLLRGLNTQTHISIVVPNGKKCLELDPLASIGLFLHWHNLQNLVLKGHPQGIKQKQKQ